MSRVLFLLLVLITTTASSQTVKFRYSQSLIFVPVNVNGLKLLFLLNTGANTTVLDKRIADKLELPVIKETDTVIGTAGKQPVALVKVRSLSVGNTVMKDLIVSRRNIGDFITLDGQKVDGILGTDILKNYALTIDYQAQKIAFQRAKIPAGRKKTISFDMTEGIPRVEMRLNDTFNTFFHYNSGVSLISSRDVYVNVSPKQWETIKSLCKNLEQSRYFTGQGVGGGIYLQAVRMSCIELNQRQKIYNGYIIIQPKEGYFKQDNAIGFFGNNLLEKYGRVSIDFITRQIVLPLSNPAPSRKKTRRS